MIKNKKGKLVLFIIEVLLITFQALTIWLRVYKEYYLIYDWIFYGINYIIIILLCLPYGKNRFVKWIQLTIALILLAANTTFFYYVGYVNTVVSKSADNKHELILKEYKNMNFETVRLKRRWLIWGKKVDNLMGSSKYKAIEKGTYKIEWISVDNAVVTYQTGSKSTLQQSIFSYRSTDYISYKSVTASLTGKWFEKDNTNNYFMVNRSMIIYAKDGQLYYYNINDTKQQGVSSIIVTGDSSKPSFTVVLNSDCIIGNNGLIKTGGTITISPVTLKKSTEKIYFRQ